MPINASPDYIAAEGKYLQAKTLEEKIEILKLMISLAPSHKGGENLRAQLKTRLKKFQEQLKKSHRAGKSAKTGIKKGEMQVLLVGKTNSGKSSLLSVLTNARPKISEIKFTTNCPEIGTMNYTDMQMQIIENPAINSEKYDKGLPNTADVIIIIVPSLEEISEIKKQLENSKAKQIIAFNKSDLLSEKEIRKISATLHSKKHDFVLISTKNLKGIEELKKKIFQSFDKIRIYTKNPNEKEPDKAKPVILEKGATIKDVAEKILHGFSINVKQAKIWGPSSKFPGQIVGANHKLKDLDVVEFKTK